jgi:WD40 repeat protein
VWDVDSGRLLGLIAEAGLDTVVGLAFTENGDTLAVGSVDGTVTLWDTRTLRPISPRLHDAHDTLHPSSLTFTPDGLTLLVGEYQDDQGVSPPLLLRWDLAVDRWMAEACAIANRNLTQEEWNRFLGSSGEAYRKTCPDQPLP